MTETIASYASSTKAPAGFLTPQQLGVLGMEKLDIVINLWEDALASHSLGLAQPEDAEFFREIQNLLEGLTQLEKKQELSIKKIKFKYFSCVRITRTIRVAFSR